MGRVIPEYELEALRKIISSNMEQISNKLKVLYTNINELPEILINLENAIQTEGGKSIATNISSNIEEIKQEINNLQNIMVNANDVPINWEKIHQKKYKRTIIIDEAQTNGSIMEAIK